MPFASVRPAAAKACNGHARTSMCVRACMFVRARMCVRAWCGERLVNGSIDALGHVDTYRHVPVGAKAHWSTLDHAQAVLPSRACSAMGASAKGLCGIAGTA
jgi:hypothetical protein